MAMLVERVRGLSNVIKSLADQQLDEQATEAFRTRADQLAPLASALITLAAISKGMSGVIPVDLALGEAKALKDAIDDMSQKFEVNPQSIFPDPKWHNQTKKRLENFITQVRESLLTSWRNYIENLRTEAGINVELLNLLHTFRTSPAHADKSHQISELEKRLDELAQRLPQDATELDEPKQLCGDLSDIISELPAEFPEPVRILFEAISQGTATGAHLTDEAVSWLSENELLQTLSISWKKNGA